MDSSRIFIRGLPPTLTPEEFRQHFSKQWQITDAKIIPHRRIGYIGYRSNSDAARAIKYYNKSFIRMSKIAVESARSVEDQLSLKSPINGGRARPEAPRSVDESRDQRKRKRNNLGKDDEHGKLQEYLEVMQPPSKSKIWSNGDSMETTDVHLVLGSHSERSANKSNEDEHDPVPKKIKKSLENKEDEEMLHVSDEKPTEVEDAVLPANTNTDDKLEPRVSLTIPTSDEDWLRLRTSRLLDLPGTDELLDIAPADARNNETGAERPTARTESPERRPEKRMSDAGAQTDSGLTTNKTPSDQGYDVDISTQRLFIRNLPYAATKKDLREYLQSQGQTSIEEIHIPQDCRSGNSKGFAYVQYSDIAAAKAALNNTDGKTFQGRLMHLIPANAKKHTELDEFAILKLPLKKQQQIKRRVAAASSVFNWNSLYMNSNAVLSSVSDRLGISKSDLLDPTSSTAAVKQAHAETYVIQEIKAYFAANGVNLDAFKKEERSDTAILVKNFPYGTKSEELRSLFEPYGVVLKLLMPPSGVISIVEFEVSEQARSAFKSLAYRKFKDSVLFLEKAPKSLFSGETLQSTKNEHQPVRSHDTQDDKLSVSQLREDDALQAEIDTSTLFVRNLNFSTTTDRLRETFQPLEGFASARVKMKPNPKNPGQSLSMGFGFLEFRSKQQAHAALAAMDGYKLDGHELLLKASHKSVDAAEERRKEDKAKKMMGRKTKIIIKNLPFEATKKDIRSLFSAYGKLRSVRVPLKFDNSSRGFAFADFVTIREAENAMGALKDTHFLGRRLALDFAAEDAVDPEREIEIMQQKVGSQANKMALQRLAGVNRQKFNVEGREDINVD